MLESFTADYQAAVENKNAPDYGAPVAVHAIAGRYGSAIMVEFSDGRYLSPFFNQNDSEGDCYGDNGGECGAPGECEFGWCNSDRFAIEQDANEWLDNMSGATDWYEGEWVDSSPSHV
jgi:hypothetical protein